MSARTTVASTASPEPSSARSATSSQCTTDQDKAELIWAATNGDEIKVRLLLDKGVHVNAEDGNEGTALYHAAARGYETIVRLLLDRGANIEANLKGSGLTALLRAANDGHRAIVKLLLDRNADVEAKTNNSKSTPLILASQLGRLAVVKLLLLWDADVKARRTDGSTALMLAAQMGQEAVVKLLLAHGSDIEAKTDRGFTALSMAASEGHIAVIKALLNNGAAIEAKNGPIALIVAADAGQKAAVEVLLDNRADIEAKSINSGSTALIRAVIQERVEVVKMLLDRGADIQAKTKNGYTALTYATEKPSTEVRDILLEHIANSKLQDQMSITNAPAATPKGQSVAAFSTVSKGDPSQPVSLVSDLSSRPKDSEPLEESSSDGENIKYGRFQLYDSDDTNAYHPDLRRSAEAWFKKLTDVHYMLQRAPAKHNGDPVKIAIIDTGVDYEHPLIQTEKHRIKGWADWTKGREGAEGRSKIDRSGHGTHSTWLLLRYAPSADIYVEKVSIGDRPGPNFPSHVAKAIDHAVTQWNVDIITMSFGWKGRVPGHEEVFDAVNRAAIEKTLMFAAASNDARSNTTSVAAPALWSQVISIFSTDGSGTWSKFNPHKATGHTYIATLGEGVESAVPASLCEGITQRRNGTSTATPIAAAIAALILQFARQSPPPGIPALSEEYIRSLKRGDVMVQVFKDMGGEGHGDKVLTPWEFLGTRKEYQDVKSFIKAAIEKVF